MRHIAILNPKPHATPADFQALSRAEEERVWALYVQGTIRAMHFQPEPVRVALEFEAESAEAVRRHVATFPMVEAGLFDVDVMMLGPWLPLQVLFAR